jgi:RNA polymerase sigma-B factor
VSSEIDRDNAGHLREALLAVLRDGGRVRQLVIELSGVPLLDAAGIATLVAVREAARVRGTAVRWFPSTW